MLYPEFFNDALFEATFLDSTAAVEDNWKEFVERLKEQHPKHRNVEKPDTVNVLLDVNIDGVQMANHTAQNPQMTPILARLAGMEIVDRTTGGVKRFLFSKMKPFIVGYFIGKRKPDYSRLTEPFVSEMSDLWPGVQREGEYTICNW